MLPLNTPKFQEVIRLVQEKILSGEWPPGHKLISHSEWKKQLGVDYGTLRQAYLILKARGLIEGRQGEALYVTSPGNATEEDMEWLERFLGGNLKRVEVPRSMDLPATLTVNGRVFRQVDEHGNPIKGRVIGV